MAGFLVRRVLWILLVLLAVATTTFVLMHRAPGGPWDRQKPIPAQVRENLNARFGLDKPLWLNTDAVGAAWAGGTRDPRSLVSAAADSQFGTYLAGALRFDFGPSYQSRGSESVRSVIADKVPVSAKVGIIAVTSAVAAGVPLGVVSALRPRTWADHVVMVVTTVGMVVPAFVTGVLIVVVFSSWFGVSPLRQPEEWHGFSRAYLLPGLVLGLGAVAAITRVTRASVLESSHQDYVRTAEGKGLRRGRVVRSHILRNGLIPVVTLLGPLTADLVAGSVIIERIFGVPGLGREFVTAISARDYPMIMGTTIFYAVLVAVANLMVDLSYGILDPRIRIRR